MNWDAIGAIGEIIGAFAVVISLVYLAIQIRTQNAQSRLSAIHEMSRQLARTTAMFATGDITDIYVRANKDYDSLSEAELVRLIILVTNLFRAWENAFIEHRDGSLDEDVWRALSREYTQPMAAPSFQRIWSLRKQNYDPDFQKHVESVEPGEYKTR